MDNLYKLLKLFEGDEKLKWFPSPLFPSLWKGERSGHMNSTSGPSRHYLCNCVWIINLTVPYLYHVFNEELRRGCLDSSPPYAFFWRDLTWTHEQKKTKSTGWTSWHVNLKYKGSHHMIPYPRPVFGLSNINSRTGSWASNDLILGPMLCSYVV